MRPRVTSMLYAGTYAEADMPGIHMLRMDGESGTLQYLGGVQAGPNPSFLALSRDCKYLYAVNQLSDADGKSGGGVRAFAVEHAPVSLRFLNKQPSHGAGPCHLTTDRTGRFLMVANYRSGSAALYPLQNDGSIGPVAQVLQHSGRGIKPEQEGAHAHHAAFSPDNRYALLCDLGIDKVVVYRFDAMQGTLTPHSEAELPAGAGPRHLDFAPDGRHVYLINELDSTITVFSYEPEHGMLSAVQTVSTLPEGYAGANSCAEICVHPSGAFVYGSNRGHDSIAAYRVDKATGKLELVQCESTRGEGPRNFVVDPGGNYLLAANQKSDSVVSFRISPQMGSLSHIGSLTIPRPVCLVFNSEDTRIVEAPQRPTDHAGEIIIATRSHDQ